MFERAMFKPLVHAAPSIVYITSGHMHIGLAHINPLPHFPNYGGVTNDHVPVGGDVLTMII